MARLVRRHVRDRCLVELTVRRMTVGKRLSIAWLVAGSAILGAATPAPRVTRFTVNAQVLIVESMKTDSGWSANVRRSTATRTSGTIQAHFRSARRTGTLDCIHWSSTEGLNTQGVCEVKEGAGRYSIGYRCNLVDGNGTCGGLLAGEAGLYADLNGSIMWHVVNGNIRGIGTWVGVR